MPNTNTPATAIATSEIIRHVQCRNRYIFQYHRHDVGSAAGCAHIKENCRSERGNSDGKNQFQDRLVGKWSVHRVNTLQDRQEKGKKHAAVKCFCTKAFSHDQESQNQKDNVADKVKITAADGSGLGDKDRKTCNTAECKIICKFEKINTACHDAVAAVMTTKSRILDLGLIWMMVLG